MQRADSIKECAGIGERIREIRANSSLPAFAENLGVHKSTLSRYEKEESYPDAPFIMKLCNQFDTDPNWLLTGEGPKEETRNQGKLSPIISVTITLTPGPWRR